MNPPVTILYATMTGNSEGCAVDLERLLTAQGFVCRTENLAHFSAAALVGESIALFLVSTWGDGEPPDDAIPLFYELCTLPAGALAGQRFAVFGLGDATYDDFCGFAKKCEAELERAGATRIFPVQLCDLDHDERLPAWGRALAAELATPAAQAA